MSICEIGLQRSRLRRGSFTLIELLIVISIIAVLSSAALFALYGVTEDAKERRTEIQISKIHQLIQTRWQEFRTRKIPIRIPRIPPDVNPIAYRSVIRLHAIRELMRMELPDRITDLTWSPTPAPVEGPPVAISPPSLWRFYRRQARVIDYTNPMAVDNEQTWLRNQVWPSQLPLADDELMAGAAAWSPAFQGSECLYLILSSIEEGEEPALEFFKQSEIGDTDGDGRFEILDSWGRPIEFLRWAPGFLSEIQFHDTPDELDPFRVDWRWDDVDAANNPFNLVPLIYSAGRDGEWEILVDNDRQGAGQPLPRFAYADPRRTANASMLNKFPNDPYIRINARLDDFQEGTLIGGEADWGDDGVWNGADNIHNHLLGTN